jgi:RND family efflux transporter MFP subunit
MRTHGAAAALTLLVAAHLGCSPSPEGPPGGAPAFPPAAVKIETAQPAPVEDASEYVGTLKSLRSTGIQPQIEGQITQILVKSGDSVRQGTPLVQIDPRRQQAAVSSQEAERAAREADVAFARQQHDRARELLAAGAISRQELEQAQTALQTAEARLKALQAQVQQQEVQLRYFTVTAPTAGIVGDVPVRVGNQVTPQTMLTTIDQNDTLEVHVQVPVERAAALEKGLPIHVLTSTGSDRLATTAVDFVSPHVDPETQSVLVKGVVRNPDATMRASQYVRARILWKTEPGLVVPVTAVVRINGQYFAFVAEEAKGPDGKPSLVARQRSVKVGQIAGNNYPVLAGIQPGDRIIVSGVQKLADGAPIVPAPSEAGSQKPGA